MRCRACQRNSLTLAVLLACAAGAHAQPAPPVAPPAAPPATEKASEAEEAKARQAYQDGDAAYKTGRYEDAAKSFESAYRIIKFPTIMFDIAQSYRRWYEKDKDVDKLRRSVEMYKAFLRDSLPGAKQRTVAERLIPDLEKTIVAESRRRREELIAKATGKNGLFLADQLVAENSLKDAALVLDRVLASRGNSREVMAGAKDERDVAVEAFKRALVIDPGFILPEGIEKATTTAFEAAQKALANTKPLMLAHVPPGDVPKNRAVKIPFKLESDPLSQVEQVSVFYRRSGDRARGGDPGDLPHRHARRHQDRLLRRGARRAGERALHARLGEGAVRRGGRDRSVGFPGGAQRAAGETGLQALVGVDRGGAGGGGRSGRGRRHLLWNARQRE